MVEETFKIYVNSEDEPKPDRPPRQPRLFRKDGSLRKQKPKNYPYLIALLISPAIKDKLAQEPEDMSQAIRTILENHYKINKEAN